MSRRMGRLAVFALAASAVWNAAHAQDMGESIDCRGAHLTEPIAIKTDKENDAVWLCRQTAPTKQEFTEILFDGNLINGTPLDQKNVVFEISTDHGAHWFVAFVEWESDAQFLGQFLVTGNKKSVMAFRMKYNGSSADLSVQITGMHAVKEEAESHAARHPGTRPKYAPPDKALPGIPKPEILSRKKWHARRQRRAYDCIDPEKPNNDCRHPRPWRITVHHTDTPQPISLTEAAARMRIIQWGHLKVGYDDIAYHFIIDGAGRIFEGRPENAMGSHTKRNNEGNLGIALMGNFDNGRLDPTHDQINSLIKLVRWLVSKYRINPDEIKGHRDYKGTECPGDNLYSKLEDLRRALHPPLAASLGLKPLRDFQSVGRLGKTPLDGRFEADTGPSMGSIFNGAR